VVRIALSHSVEMISTLAGGANGGNGLQLNDLHFINGRLSHKLAVFQTSSLFGAAYLGM